jgi:hypothetical protein
VEQGDSIMSRTSRGLGALALVTLMAAWAGCLSAAEEADELFAEQLAAGEFAPALDAANQIDGQPERDAMLAKLAAAQAKVGARAAAFHTLAYMSDDRARYSAVQSTQQVAPIDGSRGGQANFSQLIDMITNTVKPLTWEEGGGDGRIEPFNNGVYVDPSGVLQRSLRPAKAVGLATARLMAQTAGENKSVRRAAPLRKISLARLEKHVQLALAAGRRPSNEMLNLAGLEKIKYVMVYPDSGDLVLAGPASDWRTDDEGRVVSRTSGRPIVQLDDLVVMLRYLSAVPKGTFGCSIDPSQEGLARTRKFAEESSARPLKPGERPSWLKKLRDQMGRQSIKVEGIDPRTRVARVLVEADYRMKLVGIGLEEGTVDVPSYLDLVQQTKGQAPPALDVLRWWFTLKYDAVQATQERDAFELRGLGVQVKSENEMLTELGQQVHTGRSDVMNQEFAQRFTQHFAELAQKYPVYADLQNVFDLALVCALVKSEGLADQVNWHMTCFLDPEQYRVALGPAPQSVESVINHRMLNQKTFVVAVSGGVHAEPYAFIQPAAMATDTYGKLKANRSNAAADEQLPLEAWWWD